MLDILQELWVFLQALWPILTQEVVAAAEVAHNVSGHVMIIGTLMAVLGVLMVIFEEKARVAEAGFVLIVLGLPIAFSGGISYYNAQVTMAKPTLELLETLR